MERFLTSLFLLSGVAIITISLTHMALGQSWLPDTQEVTASIDSQHRFYTALFLPYGAALVWASRDPIARADAVMVVLAGLFIGGVGRVASILAMGWPHPFFVALGVLELLVPPVVYLVLRSLRRRTRELVGEANLEIA